MKLLSIFLLFFSISLSGNTFLNSLQEEGEAEYLDKLAIQSGTDKSSHFNAYTSKYARYFSRMRNEKLKFLEIGIYKGDSVLMWEGFFPNAELHFIDISAENVEYFSKRSQYHYLDQGSQSDLIQFIEKAGGEFDIIIDDGGHTMHQQITSFKTLFPYVKQGGVYVIEDLCTSYWRVYGGRGDMETPRAGRNTTVEFLKNLMGKLHIYVARAGTANFDNIPNSVHEKLDIYEKDIESIHMEGNICFIFKR